MLVPLLVVAILHEAQAGIVLSGDLLQVHYNDTGTWCDTTSGVLVDNAGSWQDIVYPGRHWQNLSVAYTRAGSATEVHTGNQDTVSWGWTVASPLDGSIGEDRAVSHLLDMGSGVLVEKVEHFVATEGTIATTVTVSNESGTDITDFSYYWSVDADIDYASYGDYYTVNDVRIDGEWASSSGPTSGMTLGLGRCDAGRQSLGFTSWSTTKPASLVDPEGYSYDDTISIVHDEAFLADGASISFSYLLTWADSALASETSFDDAIAANLCCDVDQDGYDGAACGGSDCWDFSPSVRPGAIETWYDGFDSDCAGDDDFDADGDGFAPVEFGGTDCDDNDARAFAGAVEWCDEVDNDCDELTDEDAVDMQTLYPDGDHDGYGVQSGAVTACSGGPGFSEEPGDCDDTEPAAHPGATEVCDLVDNDCEGTVDQDAADAPLWYVDADGDGAGSVEQMVQDCVQPPGYVPAAGDCDDTDPEVTGDCFDTGDQASDDPDAVDPIDASTCSCTHTSGAGQVGLASVLVALGALRRRKGGPRTSTW
jgi:hypothetical protein